MKKEGIGHISNPTIGHERKKVVLLFDYLNVESRDIIKERIEHIAGKYGELQGILLHVMPIKSQAEAVGENCEMLEFSRPLFKFNTSYYASPSYTGNIHDELALASKNAHVYLIGSSTLQIDKYIASIIQHDINIINVSLDALIKFDFSISFDKDVSNKRSTDVCDKISNSFERNNMVFDFFIVSGTKIMGYGTCLDNVLTIDDIKLTIQTVVDKEKDSKLIVL